VSRFNPVVPANLPVRGKTQHLRALPAFEAFRNHCSGDLLREHHSWFYSKSQLMLKV